ncbi:unnamed protein product [Rhizoctonia solani]|uniref:Uncharacterized protein n=1 Tax=Rhizoctonia solani TaxID=456999 RepID=A0A8H3ABR1_9AGAM|nr:unnamed protein product [Rhizoctonia solani]
MPAKDFPFIAIEYDGRRIAIPRDVDYKETIESVRRSFSKLSTVSSSHITLTAMFPEFEPGSVEVGPEAWRHALPRVTSLKVVVLPSKPSVTKSILPRRRLDIDEDIEPIDLIALLSSTQARKPGSSSKPQKRARVSYLDPSSDPR